MHPKPADDSFFQNYTDKFPQTRHNATER